MTFCLVRMYYSVLASTMILLGGYDVRDWRPPVGALSEAWSLRQYWG